MTERHPVEGLAGGERFQDSRRRLVLVFGTQAVFFVVELVGGFLTNSLALIADAGHMLSDVGALGLSLLALWWTRKPPTPQKTYGYHRLEILAALINGLALWAISAYILYEAYHRYLEPAPVNGLPMLVIAGLGLLVNIFGVITLWGAQRENLNLRSAFLHLAADSLGSLAAVAAGLAIIFQGWYWFDPLAGAGIAVLVFLGSWQLVLEASNILMEAAPEHLPLEEVQTALESHAGVEAVHDLHIWTIGTGIYALSVHLTVGDGQDRDCLIWELEDLLQRRFGLEHTTIQLEGPGYHHPRICPLQPPAQ